MIGPGDVDRTRMAMIAMGSEASTRKTKEPTMSMARLMTSAHEMAGTVR